MPSAPAVQPAPAGPAIAQPAPADPWDQSIPLPDVAPPDDDDPWSNPAPASSFQPAPASSAPAAQPQSSFQPVQSSFPNQPFAASAAPAARQYPQQPAQFQPAAPQVDPDEDEYSMDDKSLGTADAMSMDELHRFFEVKKTEEFKSDDPQNPRNIARNAKHEE